MAATDVPPNLRVRDLYHHIDMGFLNRRLCMTALPGPIRIHYIESVIPASDHMTVLRNDHLLVAMLLDACDACDVPTLTGALSKNLPTVLFRSTERLEACPDVYNATRVAHGVIMDPGYDKPIKLTYHTSHIVSDTGRMLLSYGYKEASLSIVGLLHDRGEFFEIEPLVIGTPWFDHQRNEPRSIHLMWMGRELGEILPEDIDQFARLTETVVSDPKEWTSVMRHLPEAAVKERFAYLLGDITKKDWGGETSDHFSASVSVSGRRKTAAFLLKGPAKFKEMTLDMCGARADQIHRLAGVDADISIVQHCHQVGEIVRSTLKRQVVYPGNRQRKFCVIDGKSTYQILKSYNML